MLQIMGLQIAGHNLVTEQQQYSKYVPSGIGVSHHSFILL